MRKSCDGFTLLELILVIGLLALITLLSFYDKELDLEQSRARQVGGYLYQYNNAVRSAMAQGIVTSTTTKSGTDWLKNSTCGGVLAVGAEFLPCDFPSASTTEPIPFGRMSISTAIVFSGAPPSTKYTATTITSPFTLVGDLGVPKVRADLAGVASLSAAAALSSGFQTNGSGGLTPFVATTDSSYKSDAISGKVTMVASNSANNDVWLRTDGGNQMHATLKFDGPGSADRMIVGASAIQNFAGSVLHVGSGSSLTPVTSSGVVIDSAAEILDDFRVRKTLIVDNGANVTGNINATGNMVAQGSVVAQGNVNAAGAVVAQLFFDSNNMGYYVDPSNTSNLNAINSNYIASNGRIRTGEYIELGGVAYENSGCAPDGLIARNTAGGVLSCQSGLWKPVGQTLGPLQLGGTTGYDVKDGGVDPYDVYCPAGTVMVGIRNIVWGDLFTLICQ